MLFPLTVKLYITAEKCVNSKKTVHNYPDLYSYIVVWTVIASKRRVFTHVGCLESACFVITS